MSNQIQCFPCSEISDVTEADAEGLVYKEYRKSASLKATSILLSKEFLMLIKPLI